MSTADKTRERLLATMNKSKTTAANKPAQAAAPARTSKTAPRRSPARPVASGSPGAAAIPAVTQQSSNDPYQSTGRIWPD